MPLPHDTTEVTYTTTELRLAEVEARVCQAEKDISNLMRRSDVLEREVVRLRGLFVAKRTPPPMERGMTFFANGDAVPSKSTTDLLDGDIYAFGDAPFRFSKNKSGYNLGRGVQLHEGRVDSELRRDFVAPNDFFWLEL